MQALCTGILDIMRIIPGCQHADMLGLAGFHPIWGDICTFALPMHQGKTAKIAQNTRILHDFSHCLPLVNREKQPKSPDFSTF